MAGASPLYAQKPHRPSPVLLPRGAQPAEDTGAAKPHRPSPVLIGRPGVTVDSSQTAGANAATSRTVSPQAARPGARHAPVAAYTAGLAIEPYESESGDDFRPYVARFTSHLDSAIVMLVGLFRGTSGQPVAGADEPSVLSQRERGRWNRCRDLHFDLQSYTAAMHDLVDALPEDPAVERAGVALDSALTDLQATSGCDDMASMIAAPGRWTPWASQYRTTAVRFYGSWYSQVLEVSEKNRQFIVALNGTLPAAQRLPVPPGLPRTAPYAGAEPQ